MVYVMQALLLVLIPVNMFADTTERFFQFGLFPPISSNGTNSGNTVNSVSINLLGGYSAGTRAFELSSVWNASREYTKGVQIAGLLNYSANSCNSVQISGFGNIASSGKSPLQIAGIMNVADHVNGLQLSALVNVAKSVNGVQFGLINYMEDGESGVSIGLINVAKHGVNYFFSPLEYAVGLGFGTSVDWKKRWSNQIEVQAFGISNERKLSTGGDTVNSLIQLRLPVCKEFAGHFKIFVGHAVNLALQSNDAEGNALPSLAPWTMWSGQWGSMRAEGWVGLTAGLRF